MTPGRVVLYLYDLCIDGWKEGDDSKTINILKALLESLNDAHADVADSFRDLYKRTLQLFYDDEYDRALSVLRQLRNVWEKAVMAGDNIRAGDTLIGDPLLRVDEFEGVFAVDCHSDLLYRMIIDKCYEPQLVEFCKKYMDPHRDVIDVGANIGFYTVMFAKNIVSPRKVLAIEPARNALRRLRRNIAVNGVKERIEVFEGVVSNKSGSVGLKTIGGKEEYSSIGAMTHPSIEQEEWTLEEVVSTTIDDLVLKKSINPGFLKVDVEGVEHLVFQGAERVLADDRPIILSELSDFLLRSNGSSAKEVIELLQAHEYDLFDPAGPSVQAGDKDFGDILCFPKEMNVRMGV